MPEPRGTQVRVDAKESTYDSRERIITARGDVVLRTEELVLRADELIYDELAGTAAAKGNVRMVQDLVTAFGEEVNVDLDSMSADVKGGLFQEKRRVSVRQLRNAQTADELKRLGENMLSLTGTHLRRIAPRRYLVDHLAFTPCDCNPNQFNWKIKSFRGDVEPGERAILYWPVVYLNNVPLIKTMPILALPLLYLPMSERRTGLLIPDIKSTPLNGFSIDQPLFLTLGRSQDLTLTPGYYFGNKPKPADNLAELSSGIRGPRLRTEYRYVLRDGSGLAPNRLNLGGIYDLKHQRDPINPSLINFDQRRGLRWEGAWYHSGDLGKGFRVGVNASVVSDGYYRTDLNPDILEARLGYLRSTAFVSHQTADRYFGIDLGLRQDLGGGYSLFGPNVLLDNQGHPLQRVRGPNPLHRLPVIAFALPERNLLGPIYGGFTAEYARLAPLRGLTGDEGRKGVFDPNYYDEDGSQGNGRFEGRDLVDPLRPGEREARDRLDLHPRLYAPFRLGQAARVTPYLAGREDVYFGEATGRAAHRGYVFGGALLETELAREYGSKPAAFWHAITPSLEVRYLPYIFGAPLGRSYDEIDLAVPAPAINPPNRPLRTSTDFQPPSYGNSTVAYLPGIPERSFLQAVAQVRQRLAVQEGARVRELARLDIGQGFDLLRRRPADAFGRIQANQGGPVSASMLVRYDVAAHRLAQFSASAAARDTKGDAISLTYDDLVLGGSDKLRRGIDELVGPASGYVCPPPTSPYSPRCPGRAQQLTIGARGQRFGFVLEYAAIIQPQLYDAPRPPDYLPLASGLKGVLQGIGRSVTQQTISLSYGPACDCWRVGLSAAIQPPSFAPAFHLIFTVSQFGSFGG